MSHVPFAFYLLAAYATLCALVLGWEAKTRVSRLRREHARDVRIASSESEERMQVTKER